MATILGKILRGAAIGVGSVLSLIAPGIGGALVQVGKNIGRTVDNVTNVVDSAIAQSKLPPATAPPVAAPPELSGGFTIPMWLIIAIGGIAVLKLLKII